MRWIALTLSLFAGCHTTYTRIKVVVVQPVTCTVEVEHYQTEE